MSIGAELGQYILQTHNWKKIWIFNGGSLNAPFGYVGGFHEKVESVSFILKSRPNVKKYRAYIFSTAARKPSRRPNGSIYLNKAKAVSGWRRGEWMIFGHVTEAGKQHRDTRAHAHTHTHTHSAAAATCADRYVPGIPRADWLLLGCGGLDAINDVTASFGISPS